MMKTCQNFQMTFLMMKMNKSKIKRRNKMKIKIKSLDNFKQNYEKLFELEKIINLKEKKEYHYHCGFDYSFTFPFCFLIVKQICSKGI